MAAEAQSMRPRKQEIGAPVDNFHLKLVGGESRDLVDYLEGREGAVVVFWSSICSHCVRYDAYLSGFTERHPRLGLVAVASRQGETAEQILNAAVGRCLTFSILHDSDAAVARQWFTEQTPRAFLVNSARVLLYRGAIDNYKHPNDHEYQAYLEPAVESFLRGEAIARRETASFGCAIHSVYYILPKPL